MKSFCKYIIICLFFLACIQEVSGKVSITKDDLGFQLQHDGKVVFVKGVDWEYHPINESHTYSLWTKNDVFIKQVIDNEFLLIKEAGFNVVRQYMGIPEKWITYIYENYGIYTILIHPLGKIRLNSNINSNETVDYSNAKTRQLIIKEVIEDINYYKDTPGVLLWVLGNANEMALNWKDANLDHYTTEKKLDIKAGFLYSLYGDLADEIKLIDKDHPIAIANGDTKYLQLINQHCPNIDIFGTNSFRGETFLDLFTEVQDILDMPVLITEFGADAHDAISNKENDLVQAMYLKEQWMHIYLNTYPYGAANSIGGIVFQWADNWWQDGTVGGQGIHSQHSQWANKNYSYDYRPGQPNMNEEWWGITAKNESNSSGMYAVTPRTGYYVLKDIFQLNQEDIAFSEEEIVLYFDSISEQSHSYKYRLAWLKKAQENQEKINISAADISFETVLTGGSAQEKQGYDSMRYDHTESIYTTIDMSPMSHIQSSVIVNVIGNAAQNKLHELYYENRISTENVVNSAGENSTTKRIDRVNIYKAIVTWQDRYVDIKGSYREDFSGWAAEGDFFGLFAQSYTQKNRDTYQAITPYGVIVSGKGKFKSLKIATGPRLYWEANPTVLVKYRWDSSFGLTTIIGQYDFSEREEFSSSLDIPSPKTTKLSVKVENTLFNKKLEYGIISAGHSKIGDSYSETKAASGTTYANSGYEVSQSEIQALDTMGFKVKVTDDSGKFKSFLQGAYLGLVAAGGEDNISGTLGEQLKTDPSGNQHNISGGISYDIGPVTLGAFTLYQKPLVSHLEAISGAVNDVTGVFESSVVARNKQHNAFAVLGNRELFGAEVILNYQSDRPIIGQGLNQVIKDESFTVALSVMYRNYIDKTDAFLALNNLGEVTALAAVPKAQLLDLQQSMAIGLASDKQLNQQAYLGNAQARSGDSKIITRYGGGISLLWSKVELKTDIKVNDFGPYNYFQDYGFTYPLQTMVEINIGPKKPELNSQRTSLGLKWRYRRLNENSPWGSDTETLDEFELSTFFKIIL